MDGNNVPQRRFIELLLHTENRILGRLGERGALGLKAA
jgi:hypothetical protein